ncbi:MAG: c-type cytochrome [Burkholderiales bacterium]|jgi:cytochrome c|nr:c-type cytochrome [Burkholderiales bacterium]MCA3215447.1 c-type cytochrome [Burkholderiales bacterium]MCA3227150.1 c-type cytochrome [Burkholderiales bacterium]MCE2646673.1 c-type cytochrome [Burkholderiaceae bacterium]
MKAFLLATALVLLLPGGSARADDDLYKAKNCFACHRVDRNHLGPSFRNIAARYADDKEAESKLAKRVREGGVGVWGQVPMPAQPQVTEAEAQTLSRWILQQRQ